MTSLLPGPTDTAFFERADMLGTPLARGPKDSAADVARQGYEAMLAGDDQVVAGSRKNLLQAVVSRVVPDRMTAAMSARLVKPSDDEAEPDAEHREEEHSGQER